MKNLFVLGLLLVSGLMFSQEIAPKFEVVDQMVKATYFYDNGQVKEQGFYLDGKLHGKWISYNQDGSKQTMGEYSRGMKVGKWFFWNAASLTEVDFNKSKVEDFTKWSNEVIVKN